MKLIKDYFRKKRELKTIKLINEFKKIEIINDLIEATNLLNNPYEFEIGDKVKFNVTKKYDVVIELKEGIIVNRSSFSNGSLLKKGEEFNSHVKLYGVFCEKLTYENIKESKVLVLKK